MRMIPSIRPLVRGNKPRREQAPLRRFLTTPTGCRGCDAARRAIGAVVGIKVPKR